MKFQKIAILDQINISAVAMKELQDYSEAPIIFYDSDPRNETEIQTRVGDAESVLLSYRTPLSAATLDNCPNLKFIGICGTSYSVIDCEYARRKGITISNVVDYGDEGVVEYIIFELLSIVRGLGKYQWHQMTAELNGKTLGIIGLGTVGKLLAQAALGLKMKVLYNSQSRQTDWEEKGLVFQDKASLLKESDFISLHTPRDLEILKSVDFALMKGKVLINTTLGKAFTEENFKNWLAQPGNFAFMDKAVSPDFHQAFKNLDRVVMSDFISGRTEESILRLSQKVLDNIQAYLNNQPINVIN